MTSVKPNSDPKKNSSTVTPMEPTAGGSTFTTNIHATANAAVRHRISESSRHFQHLLDKTMPYLLYRWIAFLCIALTYAVRVYLVGGFYMVSYALGIYLLNLVIGFISPREDPELSDGLTLPIQSSDEFRPFVRRLPEFKFWCSITTAFCIAILLTCFSIFDVPVFWPILLIYWIALCAVTLRKQIQHMIKYKYVPFTFGKQRYDGKKESSGEGGEREVAPLV